MVEYFAKIQDSCQIQINVVLGLKYRDHCKPSLLGSNSVIRSGSVIYADVELGSYFQCGHNVVIREHTLIGNHVVVGTGSVLDGNIQVGDFVKIESNCYIPTHVKIGSKVFIGPNVVMTNDKYPLKDRSRYVADGPTVRDGVTIGAGVTICPGVEIGHGSFIAAGAVVTRSVPADSLAKGNPAKCEPLPSKLCEENRAISWQPYL